MGERLKNEEQIGFLRHEIKFVIEALGKATRALGDANREYGEAVANSGGDWALDDSASQAAAMEANFKERDVKTLELLYRQIKNNGPIEYPEPALEVATFGSRVSTFEDDGYTETYDLATHHIPGLRSEEGVHIVSPSAPIAQHLHNAKEGDIITWKTPAGFDLKATITKVDQLAVKRYHEEE